MLNKRILWIVISVLVVACTVLVSVYFIQPKHADYAQIVGRWVRPDGGYILIIKGVQDNGKMDASYLNPRPVNVSKAQASTKAGRISIFVELKDRNYPGSFYTLTYDSIADRLVGIYHHKGIGRDFNVVFLRK